MKPGKQTCLHCLLTILLLSVSATDVLPDEVLGEAPKAFIVPREDAGKGWLEELPAFLQKRLAPYKVPRFYELRDALPKNEAGKVIKRKLI